MLLLGTGGTIAGSAARSDAATGYRAGVLGVDRLLDTLPPAARDRAQWRIEQICNIDSKDLRPSLWAALAARIEAAESEVDAVLITHGTDTLEETAYLLHLCHRGRLPVVLTAAMRPASHLHADGPQNLLDALAVAVDGGIESAVVVVIGGVVHGGGELRKRHTLALDAFGSGPQGGAGGALGAVEDGRVRLWRQAPPVPVDAPRCFLPQRDEDWPRVELLFNHAGADGTLARAAVAAGARGLVVAATGNGSVAAPLEAALQEAREQGVAVVLASRVANGPVTARPGWSCAGDLSPVQARVRLQLQLLAGCGDWLAT